LNEMYTGITKKQTTIANSDEEDQEIMDDDSTKTASKNTSTTTTIFGLHQDQITLTVPPAPTATCILEWKASPTNDILADSVVALLMHAQSSTASIRLTSQPCGGNKRRGADDENEDEEAITKKLKNNETMSEYRLRWIRKALEEQFEEVEMVLDSSTKATYTIHPASTTETKDVECTATIQFDDELGRGAVVAVEQQASGDDDGGEVQPAVVDNKLLKNVQTCLQNLTKAAGPIPT